MANLPDARNIARNITMRSVLRNFGWRVRSRNRADCGLCRGDSKGTVGFTERLWKCHRCNAGGDVFSLVRAVNRCGFPDALRYVAELAGVRLEDSHSADFRREFAERKRKRERLETAAEKLDALERALWRDYRDRIHDCERKSLKVSERLAALTRGESERFRGEAESCWLTLQAISVLLKSDLPAYTLLSFGTAAERASFALHPEKRTEIIAGVRWAGYVRTAEGRRIEVLA